MLYFCFGISKRNAPPFTLPPVHEMPSETILKMRPAKEEEEDICIID